ncbi:hypothetical protein DRO38_03885, partial [Candidatus Bathyarchaeota archaeon]
MKTKNIEKKQVRRTEMHKHKIEENRDKEYTPYIHLFFIMNFGISFMLLFAVIGIASATDYYVATWGSDSNNGTSVDEPWQHPSYAAQQAEAGDTIYLLDGTWYDEHVVFANSGNATRPIIITAYNGTPTLDGVDKTGNGIEIPSDHSFIDIKGNIVIKNYAEGIYIGGKSSHINITNLTITSLDGWGVYMRHSCSYITIDNNTITHTGPAGAIITHLAGHDEYNFHHITITNNLLDDNNHDAINVFGNCDEVLIANNLIYNATNGAGIMVHNYGNKNVIIRNNTLEHCTRGIWLIGVENCLVEDNMISDSYAHYGIFLYTYSEPRSWIRNVTIRNNIVRNSSMYGIYVATYEAGVEVSDILFENNSIENVFSFEGPNISNITIRNIPDATRKFAINDIVSNLQIEFTDGRVFSEDSPGTPRWYPEKSSLSLTGTGTVTTYNMTVVPAGGNATITVNKFDTSLPQGEILIDFTADTTSGNNVMFTVWDLKPNHYYLIKRDGDDFATKQANSSGYIQFNNSEWPPVRTFTITEIPNINITNVQATSLTPHSAIIEWNTDVEADSKVTYDTEPTNLGTLWKNNSVLTRSHSILLSGLDNDTTYYFMVYSTDSEGNTANSAIYNFTTPHLLPPHGNSTVIIQSPEDVNDNRLRSSTPDEVLNDTVWIDVGRLSPDVDYRDVIWFNLSRFNSTDKIISAKLSLFWYY